jgi:hypothetical protein
VHGNVIRRLSVIEARLEAASRLAHGLLRESANRRRGEEDPAQRLDAIEAKLEELEKRLQELEEELRERESPPRSFAPKVEVSEKGTHYPGLG